MNKKHKSNPPLTQQNFLNGPIVVPRDFPTSILTIWDVYNPAPLLLTPPNNKNWGPSLILENFRLANLPFNWSPLENNLIIKLLFVGFTPQ